MSIEDQVGLPEDYIMSDGLGAFGADYVITLRERANWGTDRNLEVWDRVIQQSLASVGVFGRHGNMVGVGFLAGNERHAVLCDLVVHPSDRGLGIGKAIIRRRLQLAEQMKIPYLYTELAPTNNLSSFYEELGFEATGKAYTRASRRHSLE